MDLNADPAIDAPLRSDRAIGRAGESCWTHREAAAACTRNVNLNGPGGNEGFCGNGTCLEDGITLPSVNQRYDAFEADAILPGGVGGPPQAVGQLNGIDMQDNREHRARPPTPHAQHDAKGQSRGALGELQSGSDGSRDDEMCTVKPMFHVMPPSGWGSDPNGPIFWKGRYHL